MIRTKKILSILLIFSMVLSISNGLIIPESRADALITLTVDQDADKMDKITDDSVTLRWNAVSGARSYLISYRDYDIDDIGVAKSVYANSPALTLAITGLVPDILYGFTIEAMSGINGTGSVLASDELKVITAMTFMCTNLSDTFIPAGHVKESGVNPGLKLQWKVPKRWDGVSFSYIPSENIDYRLIVGTDEEASNLGKYQINFDGTDYDVAREDVNGGGAPVLTDLSYAPLNITNGILSYEWWRYQNPAADYPDNINDDTLRPGTVYYLKMFPQFHDSGTEVVGRVKYRVSTLTDGYISTPLHTRIAKDSNNNIICTIYRVNYDAGDDQEIINFRYEVRSSPDPGFASPVIEGYEYEEYGDPNLPVEIFIPSKDRTAVYYYMALARSDGLNDILSPVVDYTMGTDGSRPHIPQNVDVENMEIVSSGSDKSADIYLRWDRPSDFNDISSDLEYHILISSAPEDITTSEGVYNKEIIDGIQYDIKYRKVKVVDADSSNIDLSTPGAIRYTLRGLELFTEDDGITPLVNDDGYPQELKLNKIYYIKVFSRIRSSQLDSDYSIPVSFTTPTMDIRTAPVPEMFNVYLVTTDEIQLAWQRAAINPADYGADVNASWETTYDIYMNDTIQKDAGGSYISPFLYLGNTNDPDHVTFVDGAGDAQNARYAVIRDFAGSNPVTWRFGDGIKPNTTYYFIIRTQLAIDGQPYPASEFSQVLSVTTPRDWVIPPGDEEKYPRAPADFSVYTDSNGNLKLDSRSVTLKWTWLEPDAVYTMGIEEVESGDYTEYPVSSLSPTNQGNSIYTVTIQDLIPNTLYYFRLRAEKQVMVNGQPETLSSEWITIPVTTTVLEMPQALETVSNAAYNRYTQLNVRWIGKDTYGFEVWVRSERQVQYTNWTSVAIANHKPANLQSTDYSMYYALISGLQSNTRYYIKVRARTTETDLNGSTVYCYSRFAGPVYSKTEFSQSGYDEDEQAKKEEAVFMESMQELRNRMAWIMIDTTSQIQIKLREARTINSMENRGGRLVVSVYGTKEDPSRRVVLIPQGVFEHMVNNEQTLVLNTGGTEMYINPLTLGVTGSGIHPDVYQIKNKIGQSSSSIKDIIVRIHFQRIDPDSSDVPSSIEDYLESEIIEFGIDILGVSYTEDYIETLINNQLEYILSQKLYEFRNRPSSEKDTPGELENLIKNYRDSARNELATYINNLINGSYGLIRETRYVSELSAPTQFKHKFIPADETQGRSAYFYRDDEWKKVPTYIDNINNAAVFKAQKPQEMAVFRNSSNFNRLGSNDTFKQFAELDSRYDIYALVAEGGTFRGQNPMTHGQMISVVGKVLGEDSPGDRSSITSAVSQKLGLDSRMNYYTDSHRLTREETVYIAIKLYSLRKGVSLEKLRPSRNIHLSDAAQIKPAYYKSVQMAVDLNLIETDTSGRVMPAVVESKENALGMIVKVLKLTGDL